MLEIAGGVIIAVVVLWLLAAFWREILKVCGAVVGLYLFLMAIMGVLYLLCFLGVEGFHLLCRLIGHPLAAAIVRPILALTVTIGPFVLWFDSTEDFEVTKASYRWIRFNCRASTWKTWWKRYRIVSGHQQPLFILTHAPYLWLARLRKRSFPWSRIQRRLE